MSQILLHLLILDAYHSITTGIDKLSASDYQDWKRTWYITNIVVMG